MQQLLIIGRVGQDAKTVDHAGRKFVAFSVAVDDDYKDQNGEKVDRTVWYDCTTEQVALGQHLKKGTQVYLQGKPRIEVYYNEKTRTHNAKIRITARMIQLLGSPAAATSGNDLPPALPQPSGVAPTPMAATANAPQDGDNDLPF